MPRIELNMNTNGESEWFPVMRENGEMLCSCGRPLVKIHEGLYRCSYGFPQYSIDSSEVALDKDGNLMLKIKDHEQENKKTGETK